MSRLREELPYALIAAGIVAFLCLVFIPPGDALCAIDKGPCQKPRKETWVLHEGERLDLAEVCCRDRGDWCEEDPEPSIGFVARMKAGQSLKLRARKWNQAIRIRCGKPCEICGDRCACVGSDFPKGSVFTIECRAGPRKGPFPWP